MQIKEGLAQLKEGVAQLKLGCGTAKIGCRATHNIGDPNLIMSCLTCSKQSVWLQQHNAHIQLTIESQLLNWGT